MKHPASAHVGAALLLAALSACGSPTPTPVPPPPPPPKTAPPEEQAPEEVAETPAVVAVDAPKDLSIDGDLSEWGARMGPGGAPASRVAIAIGPSQVALSGVLTGDEAKNGVWLGLHFCESELPETSTAGELRVGIDCNEDPNPSPDDTHKEDCEAAEAQGTASLAEHRAQFKRVFKITEKDISLAEGGKISPVEGAKIAAKPRGEEVVIEITMPLAALPRAGCPAVVEPAVFLSTDAQSEPPTEESQEWMDVTLPTPLSPATFPRLIAAVLEWVRDSAKNRWAPSWAPGDPMNIQYVVPHEQFPHPTSYERKGGPLFTGGITFGAVTIVKPLFGNLATLRDGDFVEFTFARGQPSARERTPGYWELTEVGEPLDLSRLHQVVRGDSLFLIEEQVEISYHGPDAVREDHYAVSVISRDGKVTNGLEEGAPSVQWRELEMGHSPDFETLSMAGVTDADGYKPKPHPRKEYTWKYDATKRMYVFSGIKDDVRKPSAAPPKKPKAPAKPK